MCPNGVVDAGPCQVGVPGQCPATFACVNDICCSTNPALKARPHSPSPLPHSHQPPLQASKFKFVRGRIISRRSAMRRAKPARDEGGFDASRRADTGGLVMMGRRRPRRDAPSDFTPVNPAFPEDVVLIRDFQHSSHLSLKAHLIRGWLGVELTSLTDPNPFHHNRNPY